MGKNVFCNSCGTPNPQGSNFCSNCGSPLSSGKGKKQNKKHPSVKQQAASEGKQLNKNNILLIVYSLAIVTLVILFAAGIFDSTPEIPNRPPVQQQNKNFGMGADLSKVNEIKNLETAVANNPDDHQALLNLAHLLNDSGFYQKAIQRYESYLKLHPDIPDVMVDLGVCYFNLKKFDNAIDWMSRAIKIDPTHQIGHFNLGIVNLSMNNIAEAKNWWRKAIALGPNTDIAKRAQSLLEQN